MPRPSLKAERRAEILDAYGRCIAQHGVEGATLEKIAGEAGLARALIRQNVGNKDELLDAFVDRFLDGAYLDADVFFASLPQDDRLTTMVNWLFSPGHTDPHRVAVTNVLLIAAVQRQTLATRLRRWTYLWGQTPLSAHCAGLNCAPRVNLASYRTAMAPNSVF